MSNEMIERIARAICRKQVERCDINISEIFILQAVDYSYQNFIEDV